MSRHLVVVMAFMLLQTYAAPVNKGNNPDLPLDATTSATETPKDTAAAPDATTEASAPETPKATAADVGTEANGVKDSTGNMDALVDTKAKKGQSKDHVDIPVSSTKKCNDPTMDSVFVDGQSQDLDQAGVKMMQHSDYSMNPYVKDESVLLKDLKHVVIGFHGAFHRTKVLRKGRVGCSDYFAHADKFDEFMVNPLQDAGIKVSIYAATTSAERCPSLDQRFLERLRPTRHEICDKPPELVVDFFKPLLGWAIEDKTVDAVVLLRPDLSMSTKITDMDVNWGKINFPYYTSDRTDACEASDSFHIVPRHELETFRGLVDTVETRPGSGIKLCNGLTSLRGGVIDFHMLSTEIFKTAPHPEDFPLPERSPIQGVSRYCSKDFDVCDGEKVDYGLFLSYVEGTSEHEELKKIRQNSDRYDTVHSYPKAVVGEGKEVEEGVKEVVGKAVEEGSGNPDSGKSVQDMSEVPPVAQQAEHTVTTAGEPTPPAHERDGDAHKGMETKRQLSKL